MGKKLDKDVIFQYFSPFGDIWNFKSYVKYQDPKGRYIYSLNNNRYDKGEFRILDGVEEIIKNCKTFELRGNVKTLDDFIRVFNFQNYVVYKDKNKMTVIIDNKLLETVLNKNLLITQESCG